MCRPISAIRTRSGAASGPRSPAISRSVPSRVLADDPADERRVADRRGLVGAGGLEPDQDRGGPPSSASASRTRSTPVSPALATSVGAPSAAGREPADPVGERLGRPHPPTSKTSGWSHSAETSTAMAGRYGSKLPGVLVGLDDEVPARPDARDAARRARRSPRAGPPRRSPTGRAPRAVRRCRIQPDVVDLPCVPVTPIRRRSPVAAASAMTCWTLSGTMPTSRAATSSGWSGWTDVTALVTARRSTTAAPAGVARHGAASLCQSISIPAARTAPGQRVRAARIAAGDEGPDRGGMERRARRRRATGAEDVDPRAGRGSARPVARGARPREMSAEVRVIDRRRDAGRGQRTSARSMRNVSAAAALARDVRPPDRRPSGSGGRRRPTDRSPRRRRARPASRPCRRRVRRPRSPRPRDRRRAATRTPVAIASATCALTAPCVASTSAGTPSSDALTSFE